MRLTGEAKFFIGIIVVTVAIVGAAALLFSRPVPVIDRKELLPADSQVKGKKDSSVYLVEFSDFQCPACGSFKPGVDDVVKTYGERILFSYRNFPLSQHKFAYKAALAAEAAGDQGKYWEMYDYLFASQNSLSDDFILNAWEKVGLDKDKFQEAVKTEKYKDKINRDIADGTRFGVDATPTFFLNGRKLELYSQKDLKTEVEKALQ